MILEKTVREWGYDPIMAEDGEQAWEILQQDDAPELLLLDWEMPNLSGIELCQRIRENEKDDPSFIILLTSRNSTDDIVTGLEAGSNDYLAKPIESTELEARLRVGKRLLELQDTRRKSEIYKERLQRELQHTKKMQALGQITGAIAHDFNNILGVIMGYTSMAIDRYADEAPDKMVEFLKTSLKSSEKAKDIVAKMLFFTEGSDKDSQPILLPLHIDNNIERLYSEMPETINIELNYEENIPTVLLDPNHLLQILLLLCENAKEAMNNKGIINISVKITSDLQDECTDCHKLLDGNWVELSVSDTGTGMSSDVFEHLFEPFYSTKELGKGLGLAMLHGVISRGGRHCIIESEVGKGTRVRLLFPFNSMGKN
ncbi:MAG: signal transduction histidine kinase [Enterobacterales bacterium]|jgi:signal transduction histidine kinase